MNGCFKITLILSLILFSITFLLINNNKNTSYWHLVQEDGIFWFVSPEGSKVFLNSVTTVQPHQMGNEAPFYVSKDWCNQDYNFWAKKTSNRVKKYGFSSIGAWSNSHLQKHIPYTKDLNILVSISKDISDKDWEIEAEKIIKIQVEHLKNDKNLIGYYTDNELKWNELKPYADKYFKTTHSLIKKYDPNHLILGVRYNKPPPLEVLIASKEYIDVNSFNHYPYALDPDINFFKEIYKITNKPIIISEFSFYAKENNSNNPNTFVNTKLDFNPFGGSVFSQKERADCYYNFVKLCSEQPFIIGTEFFQWNDEPPKGRLDGESYNFGIVDINDIPYNELIQKNIEIKKELKKLHKNSKSQRK